MHTANKTVHRQYINQLENHDLKVWDTQYCAPSKAFGVFREGIGNSFMPWSPEFKSERHFEARIESMTFANGSVGRVRMSPLVTVRTRENIAASRVDGFYANYVMAGELRVEQADRVSSARPGDLVVYDTAEPVRSTGRPGTTYEDLSFLIAKDSLAAIKEPGPAFRNVVLPRRALMGPLAGVLGLLSENLLSASADELTSLFDACILLLPLAAGGFAAPANDVEDSKSRDLKREILYFVNRELADEHLSPERVATHFGICPRYVHKIFASLGTTFSVYITQKRLERIRVDLVSPGCRHESIFSVAYRWGFMNLSTFIRLFKKRYGCTPSEFRAARSRAA
jgi:AraC-like DNA-binding protein